MPVILPLRSDPFDVVVQGDGLIFATPSFTSLPVWDQGTGVSLLSPNVENPGAALMDMPQGAQTDFLWPDPPMPASRAALQSSAAGQPFQNNVVCSPTGAIIDVREAGAPLLGAPFMSTTLWQIIGVTRDAAGVPLPSCRVLVLAEGYMAVGAQANAVIAETISSAVDGSFTINVPGNGDYGMIAYKPGDPPTVAGVTIFSLVITSPG